MITELNLTDTYILTDKEGWLDNHVGNSDILKHLPEILTGFCLTSVVKGSGDMKYATIIDRNEYKYFEVVKVIQEPSVETTPPVTETPPIDVVKETLWDGKETLEVGMVVNRDGELCEVVLIDSGEVVLRLPKGSGLDVVPLTSTSLKAAAKTDKELAFDKVFEAWKRQGLDFAYETKDSSVPFGEVFEVIYEVMKGDGDG